ncbi:MAG: hypothetical protein DYG89_18120 [Caldilinea sp. CFX5]|nr:hypothetical protein [Caldilinea sp. CFX5]
MNVGVNYPWFNYGWDFGEAPPNWRKHVNPNWTYEIEEHLLHFQKLGIRIVRWFILADGLAYGTGSQAPKEDATKPGQWRFHDPPLLSETYLAHFRQLLEAFAATGQHTLENLQLIPVLIDFRFCLVGKRVAEGWVKQGRSDVIVDSWKRTRFFDRVLEPLLIASKDYPHTIYAWEIMNEPEFVTIDWHPGNKAEVQPTINPANMREFLVEGIARVRRAGFQATIGFNQIETIRKTKLFADINQFHHYPNGKRYLEKHSFDIQWPGVIGEFATAVDNDTWPELATSTQSVFNRLCYIEKMGYPLALPWSYQATDGHTDWNGEVEKEIQSFVSPSPKLPVSQ